MSTSSNSIRLRSSAWWLNHRMQLPSQRRPLRQTLARLIRKLIRELRTLLTALKTRPAT